MRYILDISLISNSVFILIEILNIKIRAIITCPAVIFAASRKLRVNGRTVILINSISTKNGLNHIGALFGSRCAINFFIELAQLLSISNDHIGSLIEIVNKIWLVILSKYGTIPRIFMNMISINIILVISIVILIWIDFVVINWFEM